MTGYDNTLPLVIIRPMAAGPKMDEWLRLGLKDKANVLITMDAPENEALVIPADEINHLLNFHMSSLERYIESKEYEDDDINSRTLIDRANVIIEKMYLTPGESNSMNSLVIEIRKLLLNKGTAAEPKQGVVLSPGEVDNN